VLLRKPRSYAEVYNDLNSELVEFFRVLRDEVLAAELVRLLELTPFSRAEFQAAYESHPNPVERARRMVVRSFMGFGSASVISAHRTGFRANSNKSGTSPARDWRNYPAALGDIIERLRGVVIENKPAVDVMLQQDSAKTLFYLDPPYVHETRAGKRLKGGQVYAYEMTDDDHAELAKTANYMKGMVVISGYRCPLYDSLYSGWRRIDKAAHADGARPRVESIWINQAAEQLLPQAVMT
jgi:DNA adenine methylase